MNDKHWKLNTSNLGKFEEYKRLLAKYGCTLEASHEDLPEIDADHLTVITHKASQLGEHVLVDDTALEVEGASVGVNVRWLLQHLPEYEGHRAASTVLLAYHQGDEVWIYRGVVHGRIVKPKGSNGFGFDPVFLPNGSNQTLAEAKPDSVNARAKAVEALMKGDLYEKKPVMKEWEGPWQSG